MLGQAPPEGCLMSKLDIRLQITLIHVTTNHDGLNEDMGHERRSGLSLE